MIGKNLVTLQIVSNNLKKNIMEKNINKQMSLEEYKKRAEAELLRIYPNCNPTDWTSTISKGWWEKYMEDFSPEVAMQGIISGLI